jgi:hypothetical protein
VDSGIENGRQWFGAPLLVDPKSTAMLSFQYVLPAAIGNDIANNSYHLTIQKQLGTLVPGLTVENYFARNVQAATPGEDLKNFGDNRYDITTDLSVDRVFDVTLRP